MSTTQIAIDTQARITDMEGKVDTTLSTMNTYMSALAALAATIASYMTAGAASYSGAAQSITGVSLPGAQLTDSDDALSQAHNAAAATAYSDVGVARLLQDLKAYLTTPLARLDDLRTEVNAVPIPTQASLGFSEDNFVADIISTVEGKIINAFSETPGNSTTSEARHYRNDIQRRLAANQKELSDSLSEFSGRGQRLPSAALTSLQSRVTARQAMDNTSDDRAILLQQESLSMDNRWKAIDAGVRYDQILLEYFNRKQQRALAAAKSVFDLGQSLTSLKYDVLDSMMAGQSAAIGVASDARRVAVAELRANLDKYSQRIRELISESGMYFDAHEADVAIYATGQRAQGAIDEFDQSENEAHVKTLFRNLKNAIESADTNLRAFTAISDVRLNAAGAGTDSQMEIAEAARNMITTVIQLLSGDTYESQGA